MIDPNDIDKVIHEPARLLIMTILYSVEEADFLFLLHESELTKGNLSSHLSKIEQAGYVEINKSFFGKKPRTICKLTDEGINAFSTYRENINTILKNAGSKKQ
ncbi:MAG: transcriptional regulator [Anaerolineales bacterium]|nr:transcriptional regulator [Anaerolineales bacterium]